MLEKLNRSEGSVVGIRISGEVTGEDYERLVPELERVIEEHGEVHLLLRFDGFEGVGPQAVWEDLKFDLRHLSDIGRCAVIKEADWQEWFARLSGAPFGIETRVYEPDKEEQAWEWLFGELAATTDGEQRAPHRAARRTRNRLHRLTEQLRQDAQRTSDAHAEALFETTAEVLSGLQTAFTHYEERSEAAWQETPAYGPTRS